MNTIKIKLTILSICGLMLLPGVSHGATATLITPNTALFTIDFSFTDEVFDLEVPVVAELGVTYADRVNTLGYSLLSESGVVPSLTTVNALVLSTQPLSGTRYSVPKGETGNFTLLVLATFAEDVTEDQRVHITKLPYWLEERRTTVHQNQLDELSQATITME
jgi:hypothetical protein